MTAPSKLAVPKFQPLTLSSLSSMSKS